MPYIKSLCNFKMDKEKELCRSDVMVGNRLHKGYDSIRKNDYTLTECFENNIEIRNKINKLWKM